MFLFVSNVWYQQKEIMNKENIYDVRYGTWKKIKLQLSIIKICILEKKELPEANIIWKGRGGGTVYCPDTISSYHEKM